MALAQPLGNLVHVLSKKKLKPKTKTNEQNKQTKKQAILAAEFLLQQPRALRSLRTWGQWAQQHQDDFIY